MNHFIIKFPPEQTIFFSEAKSYFDEMQGTESWFPVPNQSTCLISACQYLDCHFCSEWVWLLLLSFFFLLIKNDTRQKGECTAFSKKESAYWNEGSKSNYNSTADAHFHALRA